ncbi:D-alanine--D-alanine ligase family protein [Microbacterium tumbae]
MTQRVLVIGGGESAEHDVSVASAAGIAAALRERVYEVDEVTIGRDGVWTHAGAALGTTPAESLQGALGLVAASDAVFPAIHGVLGEDGTLAALCALAHVPVVGSGLGTGAIGMDKWATKLVAEAVGIRTARGVLVRASGIDAVEYAGPVVVKPASEGSSYGVSLVRDAVQLRPALEEAARFDDRLLVEEVVSGREIDVAVILEADGMGWAAPPLEIHASGFFDTETKYDGSARFTVPAELDAGEKAELERAALTMFDALGCAGVARIDFFLTEDGPVLNEVNTMPGMTAASQVPRMFAAAGVDYPELVDRLVRSALVRPAR